MITRNLFITTHGLKLSKYGNYLVIRGKEYTKKIPIGAFSNVFILSNATFTTQFLKFLSKNGKYIFILNTAGKIQSIVLPEIITSSVSNRVKQYKKFENEDSKVFLTQNLLIEKAFIVQKVLYRFRKYLGEDPRLHPYKNFYKDTLKLIENSKTIGQLRGVDGFIMKSLYLEFASSIKKIFSFKKRSYHPPIDEANAILSLTFSIFYSILFPLIISYDLDPYVGFFHIKRGQHAALASDLLELARPELVFFSADIINRGLFSKSDFKKFGSGVYLKPNATRVLCKLFIEKILFSDILVPIQLFIKKRILKWNTWLLMTSQMTK